MPIEWISAQSNSLYITLDSQDRMYISSGVRKLIGLPSGVPFWLMVGYDSDNHRLVIAKPDAVKTDAAPFKFDSRAYSRGAAKIVTDAINVNNTPPLRFPMLGDGEAAKQAYAAYPSGTYAFELKTD